MYIDKRNLFYLSLVNPFKTMKKLKETFIPLKRFFRIGFGKWDFYPAFWCSNPSFIHIISSDVMWEDKYYTPRYEHPPYVWIHIWKINLIWWWQLEADYIENENYWEQALWYLFYYKDYKMKNPDILGAMNYWPYTQNNKSTWSNKYLR